MSFSTSKKFRANNLSNINLLDIHTGNYVSSDELADKVIQREQEKFSSIEINQDENWHLFS